MIKMDIVDSPIWAQLKFVLKKKNEILDVLIYNSSISYILYFLINK